MIWIYTAIVFAITSTLGYGLHNWDVDRIEAKSAKELEAQKQADISNCDKAQKPTKESNENYQKLLADRDADIARLSKRPAKCVYVNHSTNNISASPVQSGQGNGLPSDVLYKFSGFCETDRAGLAIMQGYFSQVRCAIK